VLSKRVPILGEGNAYNQDPDSLHCKALKRTKSLGELKIVIGNYSFDIDIIPILLKLWNCRSFVLIFYIPDC
jgi:hypothetical protein